MDSPFPTPALQFIPQQYQDDPLALSIAAMIDRACAQLTADILGMRDRYSAESCPLGLIDELAASIGVITYKTDTDRQKRAKTATGVRSQKYNGTWQFSAKPAIDAVTGASSVIFGGLQADWPVQVQDQAWANLGYMWSVMSGGGDAWGGIIQVGGAVESVVAGIVYSDLGISTLTANQVAQVVAALADIAPAYFRVFLGYTIAGIWTAYAGGQIG